MYDEIYKSIVDAGLRPLEEPNNNYPAFTCKVPYNYRSSEEWISEHQDFVNKVKELGSSGVNARRRDSLLLDIWVD